MEHILSLSYGKDSLACLGAIEELGWPLDRIVHSEVWATDTIPADLPLMVEFKAKADDIIKKRWGIVVEHYSATNIDGITGDRVTYQDGFYHVLKRGKRCGEICGFPMRKGQWCQKLKLHPFDVIRERSEEAITYLGIAADEPNRFGILNDRKKSPLKKLGWAELNCRSWCEKNGLLSPIYTNADRSGCWFCHNQRVEQLRHLKKTFPDLWTILLQWDEDSPVKFRADGHTIHDFDCRFQLEELGLIPTDRRFRWDMINQVNIFEWMEREEYEH